MSASWVVGNYQGIGHCLWDHKHSNFFLNHCLCSALPWPPVHDLALPYDGKAGKAHELQQLPQNDRVALTKLRAAIDKANQC